MVITAKWQKVPMANLTEAKTGLYMVYANYWWVVTKEGELVFYKFGNSRKAYGAPQCNAKKEIVEKIGLNYDFEFDAMQLPAVFIPINPSDYV
jgi:hypothetical protein